MAQIVNYCFLPKDCFLKNVSSSKKVCPFLSWIENLIIINQVFS